MRNIVVRLLWFYLLLLALGSLPSWTSDRIILNPIYPTAPLEELGPPEEDIGTLTDRKMLDYYLGEVTDDSPKEGYGTEETENSR